MEFYGENIEYPNQHPSFPNIFSPHEALAVLARYYRKNRYRSVSFLAKNRRGGRDRNHLGW